MVCLPVRAKAQTMQNKRRPKEKKIAVGRPTHPLQQLLLSRVAIVLERVEARGQPVVEVLVGPASTPRVLSAHD